MRDFHADAEDIAEGGVSVFLQEIKPFLNKQGIQITQINDINDETGYYVEVNGTLFTIYDQHELEREDFWALASGRAFDIVNDLLIRASSNERVYLLYGGNDQRAIFLTPKMFELIQGSKIIEEREKPEKTIQLVQ